MRLSSLRWAAPALALVVAGSVWAAAPAGNKTTDKKAGASGNATAQPAAGAARRAAPASSAKVTKPWSLIASLSDDQKDKIRTIHRKALDEVNAIEAKEKQDIMALLSDAQLAELKDAMAKDAAEKKANKLQTPAKKQAAQADKGDAVR
jgi:hypothetical protein